MFYVKLHVHSLVNELKILICSLTDALVTCLKNSIKVYIKIYIKTAPTCFGVTVTPSSGSARVGAA